jgi:hypothetical protein
MPAFDHIVRKPRGHAMQTVKKKANHIRDDMSIDACSSSWDFVPGNLSLVSILFKGEVGQSRLS